MSDRGIRQSATENFANLPVFAQVGHGRCVFWFDVLATGPPAICPRFWQSLSLLAFLRAVRELLLLPMFARAGLAFAQVRLKQQHLPMRPIIFHEGVSP
jgi:hypothetical protein